MNLAAALAEAGEAVLLADLDPFGSASHSLGPLADGPTLADAIFTRGRVTVRETIRETSIPGLSLAPADERMFGVETALRSDPTALRPMFAPMAEAFSFLIFDTAPSAGPLAFAALVTAGHVLLPVTLSAPDVERLASSLGIIAEARDRYAPGLAASIVPNRTNPTRLCREILDALRSTYGAAVTRAEIPQSVRVQEAPSHGLPVTRHDPHGLAAESFRALAREIRRRTA